MARGYLVMLNVVTLLLGLVGLGGSIYVLVEYKDFDELFSQTAVIVACVASALIAVVSVVGCISAKNDVKCGLALYTTGMICLIACQIAAAVFAAVYLGYLDDVQNSSASNIVKETQQNINDWQLTTYNFCCFDNVDNCPAAGCTKAANCNDPPAADDVCIINAGYSVAVSQDVCNVLASASASFPYNNSGTTLTLAGKVVGNATIDGASASCGAGTPAGFRSQMYDWFKSNQKIFTIIMATIAAIETLAVAFACTLLCTNENLKYSQASKGQNIEASNLTGVSVHQSGGGVRYN